MKQRRGLIAFHKNIPCPCKKQIADPDGRYLLLQGLLQDTEITVLVMPPT